MNNILNVDENLDEDSQKNELCQIIHNVFDYAVNDKNSIIAKISEIDQFIHEYESEIHEKLIKKEEMEEVMSPFYSYDSETVFVEEMLTNIDLLNRKKEVLEKKNNNIENIIQDIQKISNSSLTECIQLNSHENEIYKLKILQTQEKERQRIARDLHDTTVQNLTNIVHKSELTLRLLDVDPIRSKLELTSMTKNVKDIIRNMRNIIYNLRPMSFDDMGIHITIQKELENLKQHGINEIEYKVDGLEENVDTIVSLSLLRIVQEACNNIIKYAETNEVKCFFVYSDTYVELYIEDKGKGFDIEEVTNRPNIDNQSGFGLSMMSERVYLLSGTIQVTTEKGTGTSIYVKVPKNFKED